MTAVWNQPKAYLACAALLALAGCGAGEYRTKFEAAKGKFQARKELLASFDAVLGPPQSLGDTGLTARLPQGSDPVARVGGRLLPPQAWRTFTIGGGFQEAFQESQRVEQRQDAEYFLTVHVAARPLDEEAGLQPVLDALKAIAGGGEWEEATLTGPDGADVSWQRLAGVNRDQTDRRLATGRLESPVGPTSYVLYVRDIGGKYAVLLWRAPESVQEDLNLRQKADLSTSTVAAS